MWEQSLHLLGSSMIQSLLLNDQVTRTSWENSCFLWFDIRVNNLQNGDDDVKTGFEFDVDEPNNTGLVKVSLKLK